MVKLVSARECRSYGPRQSRRRAEYMNAGLYLFSSLLLIVGYAAQLSGQIKLGLIILLVSFSLIIAVNLHDLFAHLAGIDFRLSLMGFDRQLALVEFAVPVVQAAGTILSFLGIIFLFIQEKRDNYFTSEKHAMGMLIAGPVLLVLGSILNSCQIYERADGHVQLLQHSVQIPFLIGSCMFLVGAILNSRAYETERHGVHLLDGSYWTWLGMCGSLLWLIGGLNNVMKVFKMQQMDGMRLEKLRGGAQERLVHGRECHAPLISGEEQRRPRNASPEEGRLASGEVTSTYKDALVRQAA